MRKLIVMALVVGCLGVLASVAMAATKSVKVGDNYYVRSRGRAEDHRLQGHRGEVALRHQHPAHGHRQVRGPAKFNSGVRSLRHATRRSSRSAAPTSIYCTIHGASDQRMKLVVK